MAEKISGFQKTLSQLLDEKLPKPEVQSLKDEGFSVKKATRKTAVMITLYKKAVSGDLNAIKELDSILSGNSTENDGGTVRIIDDFHLQNFKNSG